MENGVVKFLLDSGSSDHLVQEKWCLKNQCKLEFSVVANVAKDDQSLVAKSGTVDRKAKEAAERHWSERYLIIYEEADKHYLEVKFSDEKAVISKNGKLIKSFCLADIYNQRL